MNLLNCNCAMLLLLCSILILFSCEKDWEESEEVAFSKTELTAFDQFGGKLEQAFSIALVSPEMKQAIIEQTKEMKDGDYEVLLRDLLGKAKQKSTLKDILMLSAEGLFTSEELNSFMEEHPSLIVAVRGPYGNWEHSHYIPPVVFIPSTFKESQRSISGTQNGVPVDVPIDQAFTEAVITVGISERHEKDGTLITDQFDFGIDNTGPTKDDDDDGPQVHCPFPSYCPSDDVILNSFNVAQWNGGFHLTYDISYSHPLYFCPWLNINITRLNPDGTTKVFKRGGDQAHEFFDFDVNPNLVYVYQLEVFYVYGSSYNAPHYSCHYSSAIATEVSTSAGPSIHTFRGQNYNDHTINYSWSPPSIGNDPVPVYEYKLSYWDGDSFVEEAILGGAVTEYSFNYPTSDRGKKVRMMIQYRAGGGPFQGNFQDVTYGSFRNENMPLYFLGMNLHQPELYEAGDYIESPLYGFPEFRILAYQGGANSSTQIVKNVVRNTTRCSSSDFYYPIIPVNIIDWQRDIIASSIRVKITETDILDAVVDASATNEVFEASVEAEVGFKATLGGVVDIGASIGVESSWQNGTAVTYNYPTSDIPIGVYPIYYHEPLRVHRGNALFNSTNTACQIANQIYDTE